MMRYAATHETPAAWNDTPAETTVHTVEPRSAGDEDRARHLPGARTRRRAGAAGGEAAPLRMLGRAEERTLLGIALAGGEICVREEDGRMRYVRLDDAGGAVERFPGSVCRALIRDGHLRLKRFEHGGPIYGPAREPGVRAAFWRGSSR